MVWRDSPVSVLSLITNEVMDFIYDNHCHLVTEWNRDVLSSVALQQYAETISRKGSPLSNCFGFIDGMVRPISTPGNGPEDCVYWTQTGSWTKISVHCLSEWTYTKHLWASR